MPLLDRMTGWLSGIPNRPILWLATILHFVWGVGLVLIPDKIKNVTALAPYSARPELFGLMMLASGSFAAMALFHEAHTRNVNAWTFWAFIPQQALLMVSAASCIYFAFFLSHYASGTVLPKEFIANDQLIYILLALLHPLGVLRMHLHILPEKVVDGNE